MTNIVPLHDRIDVPGQNAEPNEALVATLENLLGMAKTGMLRSFVGTGSSLDSCRVAVFCDTGENVYKMAGSLAWLQREYMQRVEVRIAAIAQEEQP